MNIGENIKSLRKGQTPLKIVSKGTSGATPFTTKTFKPIGGVITPALITNNMITPNQIGSYPNVVTA